MLLEFASSIDDILHVPYNLQTQYTCPHAWCYCVQEALNRGLLPDDNTLMQLSQEQDSIVHGRSLDSMRWPDLELRAVLIREASHDMTMTITTDNICFLCPAHKILFPPPPPTMGH